LGIRWSTFGNFNDDGAFDEVKANTEA